MDISSAGRRAAATAADDRRAPCCDVLDLVAHAEDYRTGYNTIRPHEAVSWDRPVEVHTGLADPESPTFPNLTCCQLLDAGHR